MRATLGTTYRSLLNNLTRSSLRLEELRVQGATGKKMSKPSDNPSGIRPVLNARGQIRSAERFLGTMGTATDRLSTMDSHLEQMENLMVRAKETLVSAGSGVLNQKDLDTLADQIKLVKDEMVSLGNAKVEGKYIFAGYAEDTQPFSGSPVIYNGDDGRTELEIGPGEKVVVNLTGNNLFMGDADNDGVTDPGKVDIFQTLDQIEADLRAGNTSAALGQLANLDTGADQARGLRAQMGNVAARVENAMMNMEDIRIDMKEILSRYEDADFIETITNLTQQETAFKGALEITSQVSRLTILDYMR